jgi:long-chain acyl-CoA synthetase
MIFAGGAFVDRELADFFYKLGIPVVIGYGLTEACTVITVNDLSPYRSDSVGAPVAGVELALRNVAEDGVGEVHVRSRTVMRGYLDAPKLTAETLVDGWLRTGDLGVLDASGHLRLVGRAKNMIVTDGGKNVYPEDVESAVENVDCEELCVLSSRALEPASSATSALSSEQLVLVLRPRKNQALEPLMMAVREANQTLAAYKRVARYLITESELPRTASMKVKRELLASALRSGNPGSTPIHEAPPSANGPVTRVEARKETDSHAGGEVDA